MTRKFLKGLLLPFSLALISCLSGCSELHVLDPKGSVGAAEKSLIITSTVTMLIVVVPVIMLTLLFAWRYRASNRNADLRAEVGAFDGNRSRRLDDSHADHSVPRHPDVEDHARTRSVQAARVAVKPINVEVVALDWKWLFIYPDLGIASVNQLAFPVGTPVNFRITSDSVMNSFFIPQLGSQIYAMAGMQTRLHLIADEAGDYAGVSANFSGKGFSDMKFRALATTPEEFDAWVANVKASPERLDMDAYSAVPQPSEKEPVRYFSTVDSKLFHNIIAKYNNGNVLDLKDADLRERKG